MKNNKIIMMAALLMLATVMPLSAQFYHQFGFYGSGGWSSQVSSADCVDPGRGFHATLGFNYELQRGHFLFDTGLGFHWQSAGVSVAPDQVVYCGTSGGYPVWRATRADVLPSDPTLRDYQGGEFRMNIITSQRTDYTRMGYVQLPALVGGIFGHLYFLGGLKLNVPMFGVTRIKTHVTTEGLYDRYNDPITSASFHGFFTEYPASIRGRKLHVLPVDLMASAEIGYNFSITEDMITASARVVRETRIRLAFYADYSLLNVHQNAANVPFFVDENAVYDIDRFGATHVLNTNRTLNSYLANVNFGIKMTVLFGDKQRYLCHSCESAAEAGINSPHSGYRAKDNRRADTFHPSAQPAPDVQK